MSDRKLTRYRNGSRLTGGRIPRCCRRVGRQRDRREKADFLLNGRTIPGGPPDMRHFFYDYRVAQIDRFVREAHELSKNQSEDRNFGCRVQKPGPEWAVPRAAVARWNDWIDVFMPMTYRSHFAGDFEAYVDHLEEVTRRQIEWTRHGRPLEAGIASTYLYREELKPIDDMNDALDTLEGSASEAEDTQAAQCQLNAAIDVSKGAAADAGQAREIALQQLKDAHARLQARLSPRPNRRSRSRRSHRQSPRLMKGRPRPRSMLWRSLSLR